jgi:hypothetical protein
MISPGLVSLQNGPGSFERCNTNTMLSISWGVRSVRSDKPMKKTPPFLVVLTLRISNNSCTVRVRNKKTKKDVQVVAVCVYVH